LADPVKVYNGAPATYADIKAGFTIPRAVEHRLLESQNGARGFFLVLSGAAGVGKTTLARRILAKRHEEGFVCWEHLNSFPLEPAAWLGVERRLREAGQQAFLLIDDCAAALPAVNRLVDSLGRLDRPFLRLVITANTAQWQSRNKSPYFFSRGSLERLSRLTESDIDHLVSLVDQQPRIRQLVEDSFLALGRHQRVAHLRDRCSADMYVCLKNIFGNDELDGILLREYADLAPELQDIYRHVAVIQAMGGRVHRQLILRLLNIESGTLQALLALLEGVVDEFDIDPAAGLYGWATRHEVIARVVATYKFAAMDELRDVLTRLIEGLNPTVWVELETARAICSSDWGINRLPHPDEQVVPRIVLSDLSPELIYEASNARS
jgi:hypothetical protein